MPGTRPIEPSAAAREDSTLRRIRQAMEFAEAHSRSPYLLVVSFAVDEPLKQALEANPLVEGVIVPHRAASAGAACYNADNRTWKLPVASRVRRVVFVGPRAHVGFWMALEARRRGLGSIIAESRASYRVDSSLGLLLIRLADKLRNSYTQLLGRRVSERFAPLTRWVVKGLPENRLTEALGLGSDRYQTLLQTLNAPILSPADFVSGRVLLVNNSLAWGGAERQIVNTLKGLKRRPIESVSLLVHYLHSRKEHDFFLPELLDEGIDVAEMGPPDITVFDPFRPQFARLEAALETLPGDLADGVFELAVAFLARRPQVVHAWQDVTSIKAGLAACIVGVPRIVVSGRNMAPIHFKYLQHYMRPAYRALAEQSQVTFINNSGAGAADYARWLELPPERIAVLHNGIDLTRMVRLSQAEADAYRSKIGIPVGARVVGSVFRFYEEKRPRLWIETAARIAKELPDVHFLVAGTGPMKEAAMALGSKLGIGDRLHLIGAEPQVVQPLSLMDVFLLTSKLEGTPNVTIEAQWLGIPVVTTDAGGAADTIEPRLTGWVTEADSTLLAEQVVRVFNHPEWAEKAARRAPQFIEQRFGVERMVDDTLAVYGLASAPASDLEADGGLTS